jgi:hypothetical protein
MGFLISQEMTVDLCFVYPLWIKAGLPNKDLISF